MPSTSLLSKPNYSCMLSSLSIRTFCMLITVGLNSWSDNSNIAAISHSQARSVSSNCGFGVYVCVCVCVCLFICLVVFFLIARHDVPGKRNGHKQGFNNVVVRCGGSRSVIWSYD